LLLVLLLGACGNLPRPMKPDDKTEGYNRLLLLPDRAGVVVRPIASLDEAEDAALGEALVLAFQEQNIVASRVGGNIESLRLVGQRRAGPGRVIGLELLGPDGRPVARRDVTVPAAAGQRLVKPADWASAAREVAAAMAPSLQPTEFAGRPPPKMNVRVAGFKGSPTPTGDLTMVRALTYNLRRAKVEIAEKPGPETVAITGEIKLTPRNAYVQRVDVAWRVTNTAGEELGKIDQANDVPKELVDRGYAELAAAIAEAAAEGLIELLSRLGPDATAPAASPQAAPATPAAAPAPPPPGPDPATPTRARPPR